MHRKRKICVRKIVRVCGTMVITFLFVHTNTGADYFALWFFILIFILNRPFNMIFVPIGTTNS